MYIGQTDDISSRLLQHNEGISKWTRRGSDWNLIYSEQFRSRTDAIKRERWLKRGVGKEFLNDLLQLKGS